MVIYLKNVFVLLFTLIFLTGCVNTKQEIAQEAEPESETVKGVWIYYRELSMVSEKGGTAESFKRKIDEIFLNCKEFGLNTVFVQIRPFADSFYPSKLFVWSEYLTGQQGKKVDYDPLEIMLNSAESFGLSFHAWINPFRITFDKTTDKLSKNNVALKYINSSVVTTQENGIYFNPANLTAQKLILDGIREICENYDIEGLHIDDYFYPSTKENIDKIEYKQYIDNGGKLTLSQWRIENINAFVSSMYSTVKNINKNIVVSISPAGNIENNYNSLFADVKCWSGERGYCDIIIPQLYFGFENKTLPYEKALNQWLEFKSNEIKMVSGIGAYKAAEPETQEWENPEILNKQVNMALDRGYDGYCLFSYSSLLRILSNK